MRHSVLVCGLLLVLVWATPAVAGNQIDAADLEALRVADTLTWTYQPFLVDGIAEPVCSAITLIYVQRG